MTNPNEYLNQFSEFLVTEKIDLDYEWCRRQAQFCTLTGISPSEYKQLDANEIRAFYDWHEELNKQRSK